MRLFTLLPKDDVETKIIDSKYLTKIFDYVDHLEANFPNDKKQIMIYLLLDTGMRLNELLHVQLSNIDLENGIIRLTFTKTRKHRYVYMTEKTTSLLSSYIHNHNILDYIMVNHKNKQVSSQSLYKFLREIKEACDIPEEVSISFHKFRHTYATQCLKNGANLVFVKNTLGHSDLSQTQKYLHLDNKTQKREHSMFSPLNTI